MKYSNTSTCRLWVRNYNATKRPQSLFRMNTTSAQKIIKTYGIQVIFEFFRRRLFLIPFFILWNGSFRSHFCVFVNCERIYSFLCRSIAANTFLNDFLRSLHFWWDNHPLNIRVYTRYDTFTFLYLEAPTLALSAFVINPNTDRFCIRFSVFWFIFAELLLSLRTFETWFSWSL